MKYAHYNETNGKLLGWYDSEIHETIPTPNIEVSETDWQIAIDNNCNYVDADTNIMSIKDFRTFEQLQAVKLRELESAYNNANQEDIEYLDTTFQADKYSQNLIVSVLSAGSVPDEFFWLDATNNQVTMTYEDLQGFSLAVLARSQINFVKYQDLKAQVNTATDIDELDSVVW